VVAELERRDPDRSDGRLARGRALLGRLEGVVEGVAHDVDQRIDQLLDDQLVELGIAAGEFEGDFLPEIDAQPAHDAR
jgi:hypothetical protein